MPTEERRVSANLTSAGAVAAVEELLRLLVDARFVLTDRDGAVTRWSRPAEELFGWPNARMLGRSLVETLGFTGDLPEYGGVVQTVARRKDGTELELTVTFVPVGMSQSLEFNGFLEALEIAAPRGNALRQLQRSHKTVVDWVSAAMGGHARLDEEDLAAGTIVAFRPLIDLPPAPLPPEEVPDADPTAAAAGQIADAVEAALGRSEGLEHALEARTAELEEARGNAEAARGEIAKATERIASLGSELSETRRVLDEMRAQAEEERERTRAAVDQTREIAERLERELAGTPQAQEHLSAQLEETRATLSELRATREKVEALEAGLANERGAGEDRRRIETELRETRARVDELGIALGEARERSGEEAVSALADMRDRVEALARELARVRDAGTPDEVAELRERLAALEAADAEVGPELRDRLAALEGMDAETLRDRLAALEGVDAEALRELLAALAGIDGGLLRERFAALAADDVGVAPELRELVERTGRASRSWSGSWPPRRGPRTWTRRFRRRAHAWRSWPAHSPSRPRNATRD